MSLLRGALMVRRVRAVGVGGLHWFSTAATPPRPKPKVIVLAGPTGIGKTHLSLQLARSLGGEVVSSDSVQQYRGMDIGSNKVSANIRAEIPHHCIDIASLDRQTTVVEFAAHAHRAIDDIIARGKTPIIVGGSGFYLRWLLHPPHATLLTAEVKSAAAALMSDMTTSWPDKLDPAREPRLQPSGRDWLLQLLEEPRAREKPEYLQHSIELVLAAGGERPLRYVPPTIDDVRALPYDYRCFYLTCDREWLNRWTDLRCERMIQDGLLQEVKQLEATQQLSKQKPLASAIGYRQALALLEHFPSDYDATQSLSRSPSRPNSSSSFPSALQAALKRFPIFLAELQAASRALIRRQDIMFRVDNFYQFLPIPTPPLPSSPRIALDLESTSVPDSTWVDIHRKVTTEVHRGEEEYWQCAQWHRPQTTRDDDDEEGQPAADSPTTTAFGASSLQQDLRARTKQTSRAAQRARRRYIARPLLFGPHKTRHIEDLIRRVAEYRPHNTPEEQSHRDKK